MTSAPAPKRRPSINIGALRLRGRTNWSRLKRLGSDKSGVAMMEFAFASVPFFFLLFAVIELGLIFVANLTLSNATLNMVRLVRVGKIVLPGNSVANSSGTQMSLSDFKAAVCSNMPLLSNATCLKQLQVDVRTQTSFQSGSSPNPMSSNNFTTAGFCFYSGAPGNIVTMRVYFLWPIMTPLILTSLSNANSLTTGSGTSSGSFFVLTSNEVFKNEPNATTTNSGNGC